MTSFKAWYQSRTIWASIVSVALGIAGWMGLGSGEVDQGILTDQLIELVGALAGLVAILGRLSATARIG